MSHGPAVCSSYTFLNGFDEGTGRTQSRRVRCESGSQSIFAPQGGELGSKMGCLAGRKCVFSQCKTNDFVFFHKKSTKQVLVSDHWHHKVASSAPECKKCCVLYYFLDAPGGADGGMLDVMAVSRINRPSG